MPFASPHATPAPVVTSPLFPLPPAHQHAQLRGQAQGGQLRRPRHQVGPQQGGGGGVAAPMQRSQVLVQQPVQGGPGGQRGVAFGRAGFALKANLSAERVPQELRCERGTVPHDGYEPYSTKPGEG